MKDRSEYYHKRYEEHKNELHEKYVSTYKSYESYIKLADVKKIMTRHKKDIGLMSHGILMDEIERLDRVRLHGELFNESKESEVV